MHGIGWRWIAAWSLAVLVATVAPGQTSEPRIEFTRLKHDFGNADSGPNLETTFAFKNAGEGVLVIEKVKGG